MNNEKKEVKGYEKDEGYQRFKKKIRREHRIKSLLFGVAGGLIGAAVSVAACKFANPSRMAYVAPAVSAVSLAATFGARYFLRKPSDKKIAARLDKDLHLQEKVATRVEFDGKEGVVIDKQREDAVKKLDEKPVKAVQRKLASVTIPVLVVAAGLFAGSFFRPNISSFPSHIIDPINPGNINDVNSAVNVIASDAHEKISDIDPADDVADKIDEVIDKVVNDLEDETDESKRDQIVENGKDEIDKIVDDANSKEEIGDELIKSDDDALKKLGQAIKDGDEVKISEALDQLYDEINKLNGQALVDKLHAIASAIRTALNDSKIPEGDALRSALLKLADALDKEADELQKNLDNGQDTSDQTKEDVKKDLDEAKDDVNNAIEDQKKNEQAGETAKDALDQMKDPTGGDQDGSGNQSGEQGSGDPNGGSGENGSGGQQGSGDQEGSGEQPGSGDQSGSGDQPGSDSGSSGKGDPGQDGNDQPGGTTGGGGDGTVDYPGNDHVFTDKGDTQYGDVIDDQHNGARTDANENSDGDSSINDAIDDYFNDLYGNEGNKKNP